MFNLSKANMTAIIALIFVLGLVIVDTVVLFHKSPDKDITLLVLTNLNGLAGFVAGYYFNKKTSAETKDSE